MLTRKHLLLSAILIFTVGLLCSCGEEEAISGGGALSLLTIAPSSATVEVGKTQGFSVTAHYSDGSNSSPIASWSVTGGIGTIANIGLNTTVPTFF